MNAKNCYLLFNPIPICFQIQVYCDMTSDNKGWTLVARFSNGDEKNWMKNSGEYWYDRKSAVGQTTNPADNTDMISPAFWSVNGTEFKITRSDDSSHTALLYTTGDCLGGQTFRSKVTSYGDFRNSKIWGYNKCHGSCDVQYGGQYKSTDGFNEAECDGSMQSRNKIGFWCDYDTRGAVLMIGGAGGPCRRGDHGIGVTHADEASLAHDAHGDVAPYETEYDFGNNGDKRGAPPSSSYSLNFWVR